MGIYRLTHWKTGEHEMTGTPAQIKAHFGLKHVSEISRYPKKGILFMSTFIVDNVTDDKHEEQREKTKYRLFQNGELKFCGFASQIANKYKVTIEAVRGAAKTGYKLAKKYYVERDGKPLRNSAQNKENTEINLITKEPYEFKGTKMILHKNRRGELIKTTFLPLNN